MAKRKAESKATNEWPGATLWKLDEIQPYSHNARTHPPAQVDFLAAILLKHGPDQPIVVDESGVILKGHGRRLAALKAEMKTFPVVQRLGMTDDDKRAMRIADNQTALMSGWDNELVKFEIESLKRGGYDVTLLGFGDAQLVSFMTTPGPPAGGFATFDENIPTQYCCPRCNYAWSGDPTGGRLGDGKNDQLPVRVRGKDQPANGEGETPKVRARPLVAGKKPPGKGPARKPKQADGTGQGSASS